MGHINTQTIRLFVLKNNKEKTRIKSIWFVTQKLKITQILKNYHSYSQDYYTYLLLEDIKNCRVTKTHVNAKLKFEMKWNLVWYDFNVHCHISRDTKNTQSTREWHMVDVILHICSIVNGRNNTIWCFILRLYNVP